MGSNNPFNILFVLVAVGLIFSASFAILAPNLGVKMPTGPTFPQLDNLNYQGNQTALQNGGWAFYETHNIKAYNTVKYSVFNPNKQVLCLSGFVTLQGVGDGFQIQRYETFFFLPYWITEPVQNQNGLDLNQGVILVQSIVDDFNGTYSTYNIDIGNTQYQSYISFSPLPGFTTMTSSWNSGHGFTVLLYANAYAAPSWSDQLVAYLTWFGSLIYYFVSFIWYMGLMFGAIITFMSAGFIPVQVSGAIILLVGVALGSAFLMFLRGNSGGGK